MVALGTKQRYRGHSAAASGRRTASKGLRWAATPQRAAITAAALHQQRAFRPVRSAAGALH
jgi:hypothetical protein